MVVIFDHTAYRNGYMKFIQYFQCYINLSFSTIHHDQIRKNIKTSQLFPAFLFLQTMPESSGEDLTHTCIIIRPLHTLNVELTIIVSFRFAPLINNHRPYRGKSIGIGNIIRLHTHQVIKIKQLFYFFYCTDRSSFFTLDTLLIFFQYHLCIFRRKLNKLFFFPFFRDTEMNLMPTFFSKPCFQDLPLFRFHRKHQFARNIWRSGIKLLNKAGEDLCIFISLGNPQIKMISADQTAIADKEYLYHRILMLSCKSHNIPVLAPCIGNLLLLCNLLHAVQKLPVFNCFLKFQIIRCLLHLFLQIL